jgi:NAD(P)-dependent dehydrogenase (short-subunit alcohol dehydrogenase family)
MDLGLEDQVIIVTGGSRGIGRAVAEAFLKEGAHVMIASLRPESVEKAVKDLGRLGSIEGMAADVPVEEDVMRLVRETVRRFDRLDVMVANAGIGGASINLADMSVEEWDRMIEVHLRGTFLCGREAARAMRETGRRGRIVTVASTSSYQSEPQSGHYNTAKAGMLGLTRSMAVDFADWSIRVNSVAPGWVRTDMTVDEIPPPGQRFENCGVMPRVGEPEEIASAILFLASESCGFLTGATLVIDGGQIILPPKATGVEVDP